MIRYNNKIPDSDNKITDTHFINFICTSQYFSVDFKIM